MKLVMNIHAAEKPIRAKKDTVNMNLHRHAQVIIHPKVLNSNELSRQPAVSRKTTVPALKCFDSLSRVPHKTIQKGHVDRSMICEDL